jgi:SPP1 family predicted phage head-tail adaptor
MNPGKLDRRIVLQKRVVSKDAAGGRVETWADESTVCAEFVAARGKEAVQADADRSSQFQQFRIRYRTLNPADYRILYRSKFYDITAVVEEGRRVSLLIDTTATQGIN